MALSKEDKKEIKDMIYARFEVHEEKMAPIYDAYVTSRNAGKFVIWFSKVILAVGIIVGAIVAVMKGIK